MSHTVLLVHNRYIRSGGEDSVYATEKGILSNRGHRVLEFTDDNSRAEGLGCTAMIGNLLWSQSRLREFGQVLDEQKPDIVHIHNLYYMIGPGIYYACRKRRIPVVQTLHNFRLGCINGRLSRNERPCERCCNGKFRWPGILNRCFQDSLAKSLALTAAVDLHHLAGTWRNKVDLYIALSKFARSRHVRSGAPESKIVVKPNCLEYDPGPGTGDGNYCLFVGRLDTDKGVAALLESRAGIPAHVELRIVGDGPLAPLVQQAVQTSSNIKWLGAQSRDQVLRHMRGALLFLFPSLAYENFPVVIAEAFATGLPVVGSDRGSTRELIEKDVTGALFPAGNGGALAHTVSRLLSSPEHLARLRINARAEYERKYTAAACYSSLVKIYREATCRARGVTQ